jgi:glycosyltransferase involved in cell wall biosynthesis
VKDLTKVTFFTEHYLIGGAERYLCDLMSALDPAHYDVALISNPNPAFDRYLQARQLEHVPRQTVRIVPPAPGLGTSAPAAASGSRSDAPGRWQPAKAVVRGLWRNAALLPNLALLAATFRSARPDILHVNNGGYPGGETCRIAPIAARAAGVSTCVMTVHNLASPPAWPRWVERRIDARVGRSTAAILGMSGAVARALVEARGFSPEKVMSVDLGISPPQSDVPGRRKELGIPVGAVVVGMVGSFEPRKGQRWLVEAFARVGTREQGRDLRLCLIGGGETEPQVKAQVRDLGIQDKVVFTGYRADAAELSAAFDVVVVPSTGFEGQGYVILEAMAHGTPVIASAVGGFGETVAEGVTGLLVPPRNVAALAQAISRLVEDASLRQQMGAAGRKRYDERFTLAKMLEYTQRVYRAAPVRTA